MLKKLKNKKVIILLIILAVGIYLYTQRSATKPIEVEKATLERNVVTKTVSGSGVVTSENEADLAFLGTGRITELNVKKGDFVEKDTLLARIYDSGAYSSTTAKKDARDIALRDLELYRATYQDNHKAVGGTESYEIAVRRLEELVSASEATYQAAMMGLSSYYLTAPFTGTILDVQGDVGEIASATSPVIKIADITKLVLEVELDQEDFSFVRLGQKTEVTLDSYPDDIFMGEVVEVPLFVDSADQESFLVKIALSPQDKPILLNMDGDVSIIIATTNEEVNTLTFDQVFFDDEDKPYVWVDNNGVLAKKYIEIGLEGDIYTHIKSDISETIVVPSNPDQEAKEGLKTQVKE